MDYSGCNRVLRNHVLRNQRGVVRLLWRVCQSLLYKYSHHGRFQAAKVRSLNVALGRNEHMPLFQSKGGAQGTTRSTLADSNLLPHGKQINHVLSLVEGIKKKYTRENITKKEILFEKKSLASLLPTNIV